MNARRESVVALVVEFWRSFCVSPLYDTGFGDAVSQSGIAGAETVEEVLCACSYLRGAADMARLVCPYQSPSWRIAQYIGCSAGILVCLFKDGQTPDRANVEGRVAQWTRELADLARERQDGPNMSHTVLGCEGGSRL